MVAAESTLEVTEFAVDPVNHAAFSQAVRMALPILARQPGMLGFRFGKIVEPNEGFFLVVEWRLLADHVEGFRGSPDFEEFVGQFRPFLRCPSRVRHVSAGSNQPDLTRRALSMR